MYQNFLVIMYHSVKNIQYLLLFDVNPIVNFLQETIIILDILLKLEQLLIIVLIHS